MAGEIAVPIQECPDLVNETVTIAITDADTASITEIPVFYCERDTLIDFATVWWERQSGSSTAIQLTTGPVAVVGTLADMDGATSPILSDQAITNVLAANQAALTAHEFIIDTDNNFVPAGNIIMVDITGGGSSNLDYITVQMRIRTRIR